MTDKPKLPEKIEYKVMETNSMFKEEFINNYAADGWEIVGFTEPNPGSFTFIFKRPKV